MDCWIYWKIQLRNYLSDTELTFIIDSNFLQTTLRTPEYRAQIRRTDAKSSAIPAAPSVKCNVDSLASRLRRRVE